MAHSNKEQRKYLRVQPLAKQPIRVDINGTNFMDIFSANDISEGGICIVVPNQFEGCDLESDASLVISLPFPVNSMIKSTGKILHINDQTFGISFTNITRENRKKIRNYIQYIIQDRPLLQRLQFRLRWP